MDNPTPEAVNSYSQHLNSSIEIAKKQLFTAEKLKSDYSQASTLLKTLTHKTSHKAMIPLGSLAFMPGELVHTNELTVLLGENWFVERSAHQATEIITRRKEYLQTQINSLKKDLNQLESKFGVSQELFGAHKHVTDNLGDIVEIKEEYVPEEEEEKEEKTPKVELVLQKKGYTKTEQELKEDQELLEFMNKLYLEEQNGLLEDEQSPSNSDSEKEEDEDEDENYQEGRLYASRDLDESEEDNVDYDSENSEVSTKISIKQGKSKKVTFSESVNEPSSRSPMEFHSNPLYKMLSQINKQGNQSTPSPSTITPDQLRRSKNDTEESSSENRPNIISSKVIESEVPESFDPDVLEQSIDLQVIAEEYHRRRQERIMSQGGYSITPEELEMREYNKYTSDDSPVVWKDENNIAEDKLAESSSVVKPRRVSRFKAARLAERET